MAVSTPKAGDFTGKLKAEQDKRFAKDNVERQDEVTLSRQIEREELETQTIDVTGKNASVPVVIDTVEVLSDDPDEGKHVEVRLAEDVNDATIASHEGINTYTFKQGGKYRVPENVAFVLKERGLLYDRA